MIDVARLREKLEANVRSWTKAEKIALLDALEQARADLSEWKNRELCALSVIKNANAERDVANELLRLIGDDLPDYLDDYRARIDDHLGKEPRT